MPTVPASQAMTTQGRYPAGQYAYYDGYITSTWGIAGRDSVYASEWAWEVTDMYKWTNPYACNSCAGASDRYMYVGTGDGKPGGRYATGSLGCRTTCRIVFDTVENWNTTAEWRGADWLDSRTIATHEMGHWMGADHSWDEPSSDPAYGPHPAVMCTECTYYGTVRRTIRQDDINALKAARAYLDILSANDSFEFNATYWGWRAVSTGSRTQYCDGGGYSSSCYMQYNGASNSLYQDIAPRGPGYTQNWLRTMWGQGRFRNRTGLPGRTVQVVVWNLENNTILAGQICNLPTGTSWVHCTTPGFTIDSRMLRVEYYNNTGTNVDLDIAILG
jgi:hypothetical protein